MAMGCRVEIKSDRIDIHVSRHRLAELLAGQSSDPTMDNRRSDRNSDDVVTLTAFARFKHVGRELRTLVDNSDDRTVPDPGLLRIIARAHAIQERLIQNAKLSVHDISRDERVSSAYIYILLRLAWLAPDITVAVVNGRQPPQLSAMKLMRLTARLPIDWAEQRRLLGFR